MRSAPFFATVVLVFVAAFAASPAQARICTWTGDGDGVFWSDADNWEDSNFDPCVPGAGDIAIIGGAVEIDQSRTVGELQLFGGVTINATYTLTVNLLIVDGGSLGGDGEVKVDGDAQIINGSMSVSVTLGAGGSFDCRVDMQIAAGQTVENNGTLFSNASAGCRILMEADATLINTGTIEPDVRIATNTNNTPWPVVENRLGATLRVDNCSAVLENSGLVEVVSGQTDYSAGGTSNGTFTVAEGATLLFKEDFGSTPFDFTGATIQGEGRVIFEDFAGPRSLTNGTYDLDPTTGTTEISDAQVVFPASMTFSSLGAVLNIFSGDAAEDEAAIVEHDLTLATLDMRSGTLGGSGAVTVTDAFGGDGTIDNRTVTIDGTSPSADDIRLTGGTAVTNNAEVKFSTIAMGDGTTWTNNDTLRIDPGDGIPTTGTITTPPTVTNNGLVEIDFVAAAVDAEWVNNGELRLLGDATPTRAFVNAGGGVLSGTGRLNWSGAPSVTNDGTIAPGRPAFPYARLEVIGDVALNANTTLAIDGAAGFGNVDELEVRGAVTLDGALALTLDEVPLGSYEIVTIDDFSPETITGTFSQVAAPPGYATSLTYGPKAVTLDVTATPYPLLEASPTDLDFDDAEVSDTEIVEVENVGSGTLTLSGATLSGADAARFDVVQPSLPADLGTGETVDVAVQVVGPETSTSVTAQLDLAHNGDSDGAATATIPIDANQIVNPNFGDTAGYFFANSTFFADGAPSQPTFDWIDISGTGTDRIDLLSDDSVIGPIDLGFPFRFFGQEYSQYWISSNGWIAFADPMGEDASFNEEIPAADAPNALVAWFWNDLDPSETNVLNRHLYTEATTVNGTDAHVLTFERYPEYNADADGWITGQIVLLAGPDASTNGSIKLQYKEHGASIDLEDATVGIEDASGSTGLEYRYNDRGGPLFGSPLAVQIGPDPTALPVELAAFAATQTRGAVQLQWRTLSETNNAGFAIERQVDDNTFAEIAFVEGAGTTSRSQTYRYVDSDVTYAATTLAYRLKQVDTDGTATYSKELRVERDTPEQVVLHPNSPNPFARQTVLRYGLPRAGPVRLSVYDVHGRRVATLVDGEQTPGPKEVPFRADRLASGVYFVRLHAAGRTLTQKLTVLR